MKKLADFVVLLILSIALAFVFSSPAWGIGASTFDLTHPDPKEPGKFIDSAYQLQLKRGQKYEDKLLLKNIVKTPTTLRIYAADALPARNGGIALKGREEKKRGLGRWVKIAEEKITLQPGESKFIPFTLIVPFDATPDEYIGGLVVENAEVKRPNSSQFVINVIQRAALIITQRVPGPLIERLEFLSFARRVEENTYFDLVLKNTGNVHLNPASKIMILDVFSRKTNLLKVKNLGTIFPKKTAKLTAVWKEKPWIGLFQAKAEVTYGKGKSAQRSLYFLIFPWWLLLLILLLILYLLQRWWRKRAFQKNASKQLELDLQTETVK